MKGETEEESKGGDGGSEGKRQRDMNSYSPHLVCGLVSDVDMVAVSVTLHALRKTRHEGILDM